MKSKFIIFSTNILCLAVVSLFFSCASNNKDKAATAALSPKEIQNMVKDAYVHCYPIFENYKGIYFYGVKKESPKFSPMNTIVRETKLYSPDDKFVVSPNNDAFYSTGILDVRAEPVIIKVPESKHRYYVIQLVDMLTNNFAYIGVNATGTSSGVYAVTGPDFSGTLPAGVVEIKSPSDFLVFAGRTGVDAENPSDIGAAKALQNQYEVGVISKYYPEFTVKKAAVVDFPDIAEDDNTTEQFFSRVNFLLKHTKLNADDQKIIERFSAIGLKAGEVYDFKQKNPQYKEAFEEGIKEAVKIVDSLSSNIGHRINGWEMAPILDEYFGKDYMLRTGYAKKAIYVNTPKEAYYPSVSFDADGNTLNGNNNYSITFPPGKIPPARFFWSITMYDNEHQLLVKNNLKRYSIGDRTKGMKYNKDGSLTIYIGNKKPAEGTSNWLPAPPAGFNLMMRLYGPKEEVLNKSWSPPAVVKIK